MVILLELRRPEFILIHEILERSNNSPVNMLHHGKENLPIIAVLWEDKWVRLNSELKT